MSNSNSTVVTTIYHLAPEKAALSLVGLVLSPLISALVYWIARRRMKEVESTKSRAHMFYRMISGILLAQFIGHTYWYVAPFWFIAQFVALGYVALDVGESFGRLWNRNEHYTPPSDHAPLVEDIGLDKKTNTSHTIILEDDITSPQFAENLFIIQDSVKDMTKRTWMLTVLLLCLTIISCADGFHLTTTPMSPGLLASYYVHGACLSVAVYGAMIHAHFHLEWRWWVLFSFCWSVIYFFSALFVVMDSPPQYLVLEILNHPGFVAVYGFASGILLKIQHYFHGMKIDTTDRKELWWGMFAFILATSISMATSVYL